MLALAPSTPSQVPPDLGNGPANAGVSLARLLWFLTPRQAVTLVASLLLERRVILVARDADTVSAAVHAANALLHPFRWQHIFLPLLPLALKDYLAAPMPYLVGIQADCLPLLRGMPLEETVMFDLDCLGSCTPPLGGPADDYHALPYARQLEDVFEVRRRRRRQPAAGGSGRLACRLRRGATAGPPNARTRHVSSRGTPAPLDRPHPHRPPAGGARPHAVAHRVRLHAQVRGAAAGEQAEAGRLPPGPARGTQSGLALRRARAAAASSRMHPGSPLHGCWRPTLPPPHRTSSCAWWAATAALCALTTA